MKWLTLALFFIPATAFAYAGLTTYEKQGGKWMRAAKASTFEP